MIKHSINEDFITVLLLLLLLLFRLHSLQMVTLMEDNFLMKKNAVGIKKFYILGTYLILPDDFEQSTLLWSSHTCKIMKLAPFLILILFYTYRTQNQMG